MSNLQGLFKKLIMLDHTAVLCLSDNNHRKDFWLQKDPIFNKTVKSGRLGMFVCWWQSTFRQNVFFLHTCRYTRKGLRTATMGQLTSKSKSDAAELNTVPGVRFTSHRDTPPPHSFPRTDPGDNRPNLQVPGSGSQELRRSSIYSTVDMVPQLDFYADSLSAGPGRPTLKTLRRPTPLDVSVKRVVASSGL